jgi:hypothetical protein
VRLDGRNLAKRERYLELAELADDSRDGVVLGEVDKLGVLWVERGGTSGEVAIVEEGEVGENVAEEGESGRRGVAEAGSVLLTARQNAVCKHVLGRGLKRAEERREEKRRRERTVAWFRDTSNSWRRDWKEFFDLVERPCINTNSTNQSIPAGKAVGRVDERGDAHLPGLLETSDARSVEGGEDGNSSAKVLQSHETSLRRMKRKHGMLVKPVGPPALTKGEGGNEQPA